MSLEQALLAQARGPLLAAKARALVREEVIKGCRPEIAPKPVALEPAYQPIGPPADTLAPNGPSDRVYEPPVPPEDLIRMQTWVSPDQSCDWHRSERLLKQLCAVQRRFGLHRSCERVQSDAGTRPDRGL